MQEYYKCGRLRCPDDVSIQELREACDYLLLPFDGRYVECQNLSKLSRRVLPSGVVIMQSVVESYGVT